MIKSKTAAQPSTTRRALLTNAPIIAAGAMLTKPSTAQAQNHDAELITLGERLERQWEIENILLPSTDADNGAAWEAAYAQTCATVEQIEAVKATTMEGFRVKAKAVAWCHSGDGAINLSTQGNEQTTDIRLTHDILNGLLALQD